MHARGWSFLLKQAGQEAEFRREGQVVTKTKAIVREKESCLEFAIGTDIQADDEVFLVLSEKQYTVERVEKYVAGTELVKLKAHYAASPRRGHAPMVNHGTVLNVGSISGSAFQIGSPGATQTVTVTGGGVDQQAMTREAIKIVLEVLQELNLTEEEKEEVKTDAECAQKQLDSPKTKWQLVKEFLGGIRKKVEAGIQKVASVAIVARAKEAVKYLDEVLPHLGQQ